MKKIVLAITIMIFSLSGVNAEEFNCKNNSVKIMNYLNYKEKIDNFYERLSLKNKEDRTNTYFKIEKITSNYLEKNYLNKNKKIYIIIWYLNCENYEAKRKFIEKNKIYFKKIKNDIYDKELYNSFPKIKKENLIISNKKYITPVRPITNNNSDIYFSENNNNVQFNISKDNYVLNWKITSWVNKMEVIWNWDMEPYLLKNFKKLDTSFKYNISTKFKNLKEWKNSYLIRAYSNYYIYESIITINYINYDSIKNPKKTNNNYSYKWDYNKNPTYKIVKDNNEFIEYWLGLGFGNYLFEIDNYNIKITNDMGNSYWNYDWNNITILDKNNKKLAFIKDMKFTIDDFSNPKIKVLKNTWDLIFSVWGHEWPTNYMIFHKKTNKIVSVFKLIEKYSKLKNYFVDINITSWKLILTSIWNPWSEIDDEYILIYSLDNKKLLSYKIIKPSLVRDYWNWIILKQNKSRKFLYLNWKKIFSKYYKNKFIQVEKWKSWVYALIKWEDGDTTLLMYYKYWKWDWTMNNNWSSEKWKKLNFLNY